MKGILLTGGLGTRLMPVTRVVNKHILPVYDRPMFYWPLESLIKSGIKEVVVVVGPPFGDQIKKVLADSIYPDQVRIEYVNQPKPLGMADAIVRCEKFANRQPVIVSAGDNVYGGDFYNEIQMFRQGALAFLRKVDDPERYGVPVYQDGQLVKIEEKPKNPQSNWVFSGPHLFDTNVFAWAKKLQPSARGEFELADLTNEYIKRGQLQLVKREDFWHDVGTFEALLQSGDCLRRMQSK